MPTGADERRVDRLDPARRAHAPPSPGRRRDSTSAGRPSSEHVTHTSPASTPAGVEQAGMLEAHVRQLPEHVVERGRRIRRGGAAVVAVDPQHVVGRPGRRARRRRRTRRSSAPHAPARRSRSRAPRRSQPSTHEHEHVAGRRHADAGRRPDRRCRRVNAGSARLPMITGWTNSTATWRACSVHTGADAPHRRSGREAASEASAATPGRHGSRSSRSTGSPSSPFVVLRLDIGTPCRLLRPPELSYAWGHG